MVNLAKLIRHSTKNMHGKEYSSWEYEDGTYVIVYLRYSNGRYRVLSANFFPTLVPVRVEETGNVAVRS